MPRERNLAGLAPISLPSRATARVAPTIRRIGLARPCIVGATLAVALVGILPTHFLSMHNSETNEVECCG